MVSVQSSKKYEDYFEKLCKLQNMYQNLKTAYDAYHVLDKVKQNLQQGRTAEALEELCPLIVDIGMLGVNYSFPPSHLINIGKLDSFYFTKITKVLH